MRTSAPRTTRALARVKRLWAELDYAQRRLLEIRTGIPLTDPNGRGHARAEIDELEALYAADDGRLG